MGETGRSLATRVKEHQINNAIAKHSIETGHLPDLKNIRILGNQEHDLKRKILEAIK